MENIQMELDNVNCEALTKTASDRDIRLISLPYVLEASKKKGSVNKVRRMCHNSQFKPSLFNYFRVTDSAKLRKAVTYNHVELLNQILNENSVDPNQADEQGRTVLHIAASKGYADVVRALIRAGADPNLEDKLGNTPLHLAVYTESIETVSHLLSGGCHPRRTTKLPYTPLELARSKYSLFKQGICTFEKTQAHRIIQLLMDDVVQGFYHKLYTEFQRRREIENVLKGLSSLDLERTSPPAPAVPLEN